MNNERDSLDGTVALAAMFGIVIVIFANGAHESVRCLGLIVGFGIVFLAFVYGALRGG